MFNNCSLRTKLYSGFGLVVVLLLLVGAAGYYFLHRANTLTDAQNIEQTIMYRVELINTANYQMRLYAVRGFYGKDIREEAPGKTTYRKYLTVLSKEPATHAKEMLQKVMERLDPKTRQADIDLCKATIPLFDKYDNLSDQWAEIQDAILTSARERSDLADETQRNIKKIVERTVERADADKKVFEEAEYTELRRVSQQQWLGVVLEGIEKARRLTQEQIAITDTDVLKAKNEEIIREFNLVNANIEKLITGDEHFVGFQVGENKEDAANAKKSFEKWLEEIEIIVDKMTEQNELVEEMTSIATQMFNNVKTVSDNASKMAGETTQELNSMISSANRIIAFASGIAVLLGMLLGWFLSSNITEGLRRASGAMLLIAEKGNVSFEIPPDDLSRGDEIGVMAKAFDKILRQFQNVERLAVDLADGNYDVETKIRSDQDTMNINLNKMFDQVNQAMREIHDSVEQVSTGSGEVSNAAQALSSGAQESAASLEEITASMSEISGQTKANAESASQARDLAQKASKAAEEGQGAMTQMTATMDLITKNSTEIQRVIKVIDDIAFQTNLLALNAAVEAARAGQHGKGFAVVAEEVRNLASRSAKAAQETSELIAKSGREIEQGGEVAAHTAEVLNVIVDQIKQTTELVAGIAIASNEQAQGVNQVTIGLQQIDSVTQQNTAAAEESASAANEMSSMATKLQELVARFKLRQY